MKSVIELGAADSNDIAAGYKRLAQHYEKLLKTTIKLSRISDIQWQMLKKKEQEINKAKENLEHIEQLRRQLISDISHEFGTPMSTIKGYVEAFIDKVIEPEDKYLHMIYGKIVLMTQLIDDLSQLSTLKANQHKFHMQAIFVYEWFAFIRQKFAMETSRWGIKFALDENVETTAAVRIDSIRMEQVFTNLIHNALKYTPEGGDIRVRFGVQSSDESTADAGKRPSGSAQAWLFVEVRDTGIGIEASEIPFIFDRFYRSHSPANSTVNGSGLGLAITREIVNRHGGQIGVKSTLGEGSTFYFTLPIADEESIIHQKEESH